jgi:single-stranded DNA-binding protein
MANTIMLTNVRVAKDPEVTFLANGRAKISLTLTESFNSAKADQDPVWSTKWWNTMGWGNEMLEIMGDFVKGDRVNCFGSLTVFESVKDDVKKSFETLNLSSISRVEPKDSVDGSKGQGGGRQSSSQSTPQSSSADIDDDF